MRRLPRTLWVLASPRQTFRELAAREPKPPQGFWLLFVWLSIEFALAHPELLAGSVVRALDDPGAGFITLYSSLVRYLAGPVAANLVIGFALYYMLRARQQRRDPWDCVSIVAYAWVPHLLVVAASTVAVAIGATSPLLPQYGYANPALSGADKALKLFFEFGPTAALTLIAFTEVGRGEASGLVTARERHRTLGLALAFALCMTAGATAASQRVSRNWDVLRPIRHGEPFPSFTLTGLAGGTLGASDVKGQVLLVDFWATWCPPCIASMPALSALHHHYAGRPFRLVSVNTESQELAKVQQFVTDHALPFPVWFDRGPLQTALQVTTLPTAYLVDARGNVRKVHVGSANEQALREQIDALLAETP